MKWKKFTLETTTDAVDYLGRGMFIDILPELPPDDGTARVSFYLDDDDDAEGHLKKSG